MDSIKFGCMNVKYCWAVFLILNGLSLIFMIVILGSKEWVGLEDDSIGYTFEGSIWTIHDTSLYLEIYKGESYYDVSDDWCELADEELDAIFDAGCALFTGLTCCCFYFWVYELLAAAYIILNIAILAVSFCGSDILWLSIGSITMSNVWHFIGYRLYLGYNDMNFDDDCNSFQYEYDEELPGSLCALDGPSLAVLLFLFMLVYGICQFIFVCFYYCKKHALGIHIMTMRFQYPQRTQTSQPLGLPLGQPLYEQPQYPMPHQGAWPYSQPPQAYNPGNIEFRKQPTSSKQED